MNSRLQLDVRNLSLGRRQAVIGVIAGKTVWSMRERLEYEVPWYYKQSAV